MAPRGARRRCRWSTLMAAVVSPGAARREEMREMSSTTERLTEIVSHGLVAGVGQPRPGELCIEAAICLAIGEPHGDKPSCVHTTDRAYAIAINDAPWPTPQARAEALLPLGLAQLGTAGRDRSAWLAALVDGTARRVVPMWLRRAADIGEPSMGAAWAAPLRAAADDCADRGVGALGAAA